ncbi:MAG: DUF2845 domain-containing protein [Desulfobacterales bacterium]
MQANRPLSIVMVLGLLLIAAGAFAQTLDTIDALRCAGGMVFIGDNRYSVVEKCGQPTASEEYGRIWIYNFGPNEFIYYLTFTDNVREVIRIDGYGR